MPVIGKYIFATGQKKCGDIFILSLAHSIVSAVPEPHIFQPQHINSIYYDNAIVVLK